MAEAVGSSDYRTVLGGILGTSKNVASPNTPPWRPALAVIGREDVPPDRQARELWLAAYADRGPRLAEDFGQPTLAAAAKILSTGAPVHQALAKYDEIARQNHSAGLGFELGRRALARCAAQRVGAAEFAAELFAEATTYYASRDLGSFIAARGRVENTSSAIKLKNSLRAVTRDIVRAAGEPSTRPDYWGRYVNKVIAGLREGH